MKTYPDDLEIDQMTVSLRRAAGRHKDSYATQDDYETVVAWYDAHYGHCRVADEVRFTWQGPGWADMKTQVIVLPMTQEWLHRLSRLETSVQPL
jgi:hypothetical protein